DPEFRVASDADAEEPEDNGAAAAAATAPAAAPAAPDPAAAPAAPGQPKVLGLQKALKKLGFDPGNLDGIMGPLTKAAIKQFQRASGLAADGVLGPRPRAALAKALGGGGAAANGTQTPSAPPAAGAANGTPAQAPAAALNLGPWQAARQSAINELKTLATKVASSKHPGAVGVVKEIHYIIGKLPAKPAPQDIDDLEAFIQEDDSITAAEECPDQLHDMNIRQPLLDALQTLTQ